ncbi:phospholipid carrier-dependent glycosyltransferase [Frigoribacterium sp. 2-23]|uniref:phospholipid carrier-dependent glycosyltransferase n=1 Tax=Frigoribacterium sp. 2-23 TaxID=3415006 RepID=UPI003C6F221A
MTTTTHRPAPPTVATRPASTTRSAPAARSWLRAHGANLVWLLPVMAIGAVIQAVNMAGSPQRIDDEGTYTAQAWAVQNLGSLAHYTYWYDHPPVGWLQISAYTGLTGAFSRYDVAVIAAREAMLFFTLVAVVLLWLLARRIGLSRPAAAAAALVFAVSPLAVQFHRTVYLDNVATPWLLAAFLLALSRRYQLAGFAASAVSFGIAVLSKETYLLALPFLAWTMWRNADHSTRRYTLSVASALLVLIGFSYVALAAVKGELLPGAGRVSLLEGITYQLGSREGSGSVFDTGSLFFQAVSQWWLLDPVLITLGVLAAVIGLFQKRVRPIAALVVFSVAIMFRPNGYLPVPYVIMLIPFAALLVAAVSDSAVKAWRGRRAGGTASVASRVGSTAWIALALAGVVAIVPLWAVQLRGFTQSDLDQPMRSAEGWIATNVPRDSRLLVDDAMWVDLVNDGFDRDNVIWFYKLDTDGAVEAQSPNGWRDSDYIVTTESVRTSGPSAPEISQALTNSTVVASFGTGDQQVDVRKIDPQGTAAADEQAQAAASARSQVGAELAENPSLRASDQVRSALRDGRLDSRAVIVLAQLMVNGPVTVGDLQALPGEAEQPYRQVLIANSSGVDLDLARAYLTGLDGAYAPQHVEKTADGLLVTFSAIAPAGVIG